MVRGEIKERCEWGSNWDYTNVLVALVGLVAWVDSVQPPVCDAEGTGPGNSPLIPLLLLSLLPPLIWQFVSTGVSCGVVGVFLTVVSKPSFGAHYWLAAR